MENLQIKITITDGEKEANSILSLENYLTIKRLHGVSMVDQIIETLTEEIEKSNAK